VRGERNRAEPDPKRCERVWDGSGVRRLLRKGIDWESVFPVEDEKMLSIEKIKISGQPVSGLLHFSDDHLTLHPVAQNPFKPPLAIEFDYGDAPSGSQVFLRIAEIRCAVLDVVVGVCGEDKIDPG
jgi:hypothetical protein